MAEPKGEIYKLSCLFILAAWESETNDFFLVYPCIVWFVQTNKYTTF